VDLKKANIHNANEDQSKNRENSVLPRIVPNFAMQTKLKLEQTSSKSCVKMEMISHWFSTYKLEREKREQNSKLIKIRTIHNEQEKPTI